MSLILASENEKRNLLKFNTTIEFRQGLFNQSMLVDYVDDSGKR